MFNERIEELLEAYKEGSETAYKEGVTTREMNEDDELEEALSGGCKVTRKEAFRNAPHTPEDLKKSY